jgi:phosphoribosyl-ATP pyrophosphohydrolase
MQEIEKEVLEWHKETFPNATGAAIMDKVFEEIGEFVHVALNPNSKPAEYWDELADVIITNMALINNTSGGDVTLADIVRRKLGINKARQWGPEDENGDRKRVK